MRIPTRWALTVVIGAATLTMSACRPIDDLAAMVSKMMNSSSPPSPACGESYIADPWIAFEQPLQSPATLTAGKRGWLSGPHQVEDIRVSGDTGAIKLAEGHAVTEMRCGKVVSTRSWVEVTGVKPGTVQLTYPTSDSTKIFEITVTT